jgi:glycosyltransferase involved in cell wall biosynthesis
MTDGWIGSERNLSWLHRVVRKIVFRFSSAFIGASKHSLELFAHYGCNKNAFFQSHLCANNKVFGSYLNTEKKYDIIFSGQFILRKMPLFFVEVAAKLTIKLGSCRTLVMGDGPQRELFIKGFQDNGVDFYYPGFIPQKNLPAFYASGKIFLFPTLSDPWGVVANEACAVGVPVITSDYAGVAGDLIIHGYSGYILPLDSEIWADHVVRLLNDNNLYMKMSKNALSKVQEYSYENAAQGIVNAIRYVEIISGK